MFVRSGTIYCAPISGKDDSEFIFELQSFDVKLEKFQIKNEKTNQYVYSQSQVYAAEILDKEMISLNHEKYLQESRYWSLMIWSDKFKIPNPWYDPLRDS